MANQYQECEAIKPNKLNKNNPKSDSTFSTNPVSHISKHSWIGSLSQDPRVGYQRDQPNLSQRV